MICESCTRRLEAFKAYQEQTEKHTGMQVGLFVGLLFVITGAVMILASASSQSTESATPAE